MIIKKLKKIIFIIKIKHTILVNNVIIKKCIKKIIIKFILNLKFKKKINYNNISSHIKIIKFKLVINDFFFKITNNLIKKL